MEKKLIVGIIQIYNNSENILFCITNTTLGKNNCFYTYMIKSSYCNATTDSLSCFYYNIFHYLYLIIKYNNNKYFYNKTF